MLFSDSPGARALRAISDLRTVPFWLDVPERPAARPALARDALADLLVVGAGFTGLWTALLAKRDRPDATVVLVEAGRIADGATGRNGGFLSHSITHGAGNAVARWPHEAGRLGRLGHRNLAELIDDVSAFGIECDLRTCGELTVAVEAYQLEELRAAASAATSIGDRVRLLDAKQVRQRVDSPNYVGGLLDPDVALVDPARLAWGLADACASLGVDIYEGTPIAALADAGPRVVATTPAGTITAKQVALATNAYPGLVPSLGRYVVPVYDYALVTEPLTEQQWSALGWEGRMGLSDSGNQFHYYRPTADGRILWGGYDAVYHRERGVDPAYEVDHAAFGRLAEHFLQTFPQLDGLRFTHGWGGAIDTCSRFSAFWGSAHGGKTAYVAGFTGLGLGASRFGARVMLDRLAGVVNERTSLQMVRSKPLPFPPEPLRSIGIDWTTRALAHADRHEGRRNLWLRALDRVGLGFAS